MKMKPILALTFLMAVSHSAWAFHGSCQYICKVEGSDLLILIQPPLRPMGIMAPEDMDHVNEACAKLDGEIIGKRCPTIPPGAR